MALLEKKTGIFTDIYNDYYPLVYSVVNTKVNDSHEVKDICQEIFTRFYDKFEEIENPRKWLLGAMKYVVFEFYRRNKGNAVCMDELFEDMNLVFVNGFRDTRIMIQDALEDMDNYHDERERILFELIAIYGYTHKEAADALGYTVRQVRYRYGLVTQRLSEYFRKRGVKNMEDLL